MIFLKSFGAVFFLSIAVYLTLTNKSEISRGTQRLHCNVDFLCFSQWYESVKAERTYNCTITFLHRL